MKKYFYDIEIFKNFFSVIFVDKDTDEKYTYVISENTDDRYMLRDFLNRNIQLIGYNNIHFDGPVLVYIIKYIKTKNINKKLYNLGQMLVDKDNRYNEDIKKLKWSKAVKWTQMDLMKIMAFDRLGISLKQISINLNWHKIQDLPLPYDHVVNVDDEDEVNLILDYNLNDVLITKELFFAIHKERNLRKNLSQLYDVDLTNASDSKIGNILLEKIYSEKSGKSVRELRDLRTKYVTLNIRDCIGKNIEFRTKKLQHFLQDLKNITVIESNEFKYKRKLTFDNIEYDVGIGGLHSRDKPDKFESTDKYIIRDADVASYYPSIMLNNSIKPTHLGEEFTNIFEIITKERLEAKKNRDEVKADGLKLTINSIFGKLGSETFWLEDVKALLSVTVSTLR